VRIEGSVAAERIIVERTQLDANGSARGTGEEYAVPASLVITAIGYATPPIDGVPYDERGGRFRNEGGRIGAGLYCVGWARRGPSGTIGTNRPDGYEVAEQVAALFTADGGSKPGAAGLQPLLEQRGVVVTDFADWRRIERAETARARPGAPREKFVRREDWLAALGR
jgi:ferredoxin--NADP+ reductase